MKKRAPLPTALKDRAASLWQTFLSVVTDDGVLNLLASLPDLEYVWALSDFVAQSCIRAPHVLTSLANTGDITRSYSFDTYRSKLSPLLFQTLHDGELALVLRSFRRREMVRIAWRDLTGQANLTETMNDLSALAEACLDEALGRLHAWQSRKLGVPISNTGVPQNLVVFGMGKLGACELNFSSDIDLIFAYPESGHTEGGRRRISNQHYFTDLARRLIKAISTSTTDGHVFRVDMRLRPYGENGPLVMSLDNLLEYYQDQGQEWERYALIKAREVAGDYRAGFKFLTDITPFIFRRYLDYNIFDALRDLKQRIKGEVQRKGMAGNIKLGPGGIREVEFVGQIFQLLHGGRMPELREKRMLRVLDLLGRNEVLPQITCDKLARAYILLRNTEHRLQEFADQQTHDLPREIADQERLSFSLGYTGWEMFFNDLKAHMDWVHAIFCELLAPSGVREGNGSDSFKVFEEIWTDPEKEGSVQTIERSGFDCPLETVSLLVSLRDVLHRQTSGHQGRKHFNRLVPLVLQHVLETGRPTIALGRILKIITTVAGRTAYLALLSENPGALSLLVKLCTASPWVGSLVAQYPILLDELLDPRLLYSPPGPEALKKELQHRLRALSPNDIESQLDELRRFKQVNVLRVAAADVIGALTVREVSDHLTSIAEKTIEEALETAWQYLVERHGRPVCSKETGATDKGFVVAAGGKFGGFELGYGSDLDLVFLHSGVHGKPTTGPRPLDTTSFYSRLGQRLIHILTTQTLFGVLYPVDMRLRPSGNAGVLVVHIRAFGEYQTTEAWTWEHQALVRSRPVAGDSILAQAFIEVKNRTLARPRDPDRLRRDVIEMRARMLDERQKTPTGLFDLKADRGGIIDIEFLVQYGVLLAANRYSELLQWTATIRLLNTLAAKGVFSPRQVDILKAAYLSFRAEINRRSLQEESSIVTDKEFQELREAVFAVWQEIMAG